METSRSLRSRALLALLLMVGFYGLALAIAAGLLWIPWAQYTYSDRVNGRLMIGALIGAGTILWALIPRIDKFEDPGPRLTPVNAPHLFDMIHDVAKATSQPRPEDVFLLGDVNAFVTSRGGWMGFGSRRVMGVGLPLIKGLSPAELKSVIAHEFGHYVGGDVALGPWIYKTRATIARTLRGFQNSWLLHKIFDAYGRMFMRMTTQISREQEFVADATAARVAGSAPAISALRRVEVIAPAYATYVSNEVMPVLNAGYLPPVSEGFDRYLSDPETHEAFQNYAKKAVLGAEEGEFDTHPRTADRIAALQRLKHPERESGRSASMLFKDPDRHARVLLEYMYGKDNVVKLKSIHWDDVGAKVYAQVWESETRKYGKWLGPLTADQIPSDKKWFLKKGFELAKKDAPDAGADYNLGFTVHALTCAVGTLLLRQGWTIETAPGRPILVVKDGERFNPRDSMTKLGDGSLSADTWKATCEAMRISGVPLAL
jgi:heat shock protein HtpX